MMKPPTAWLLAISLLLPLAAAAPLATDQPWARHTILTGLRGGDGVRFQDVNGDGLPDCVTGWEGSGAVSISFHPGHQAVKQPWPSIRFASSGDAEDAAFADLDGDGAVDVVSCCEGQTRAVFVHWAPKDRKDYADASKWQVTEMPAAKGRMWMFCLPMQVDGQHGIDLVIGSKGEGASISWLEAPANPRVLAGWKLHPLSEAGWIMSLVAKDMDGDGDQDVLLSDRRGKLRGVRWLENPGVKGEQSQPWKSHMIGGAMRQVMFLGTGDLDGDGLEDVVVNVSDTECLFLRRLDKSGLKWESHSIPHPANVGTGKAVSLGDIDGDGKLDLVLTCENAKDKSGIVWLSHGGDPRKGPWTRHEISGPVGVKYDLAPLVDLDGDGDLDVVTTEEKTQLGIIWHENPRK